MEDAEHAIGVGPPWRGGNFILLDRQEVPTLLFSSFALSTERRPGGGEEVFVAQNRRALAVLVGQEGRTLAVLPVNCRTLAVLLHPRSEDLFVEGPSVRSAPHLCADHDFSSLAVGVTHFSRFAPDLGLDPL